MCEKQRCLVHGTAIAAGGQAVLILGPSGAGKSDLALRAITTPFIHEGHAVVFRLVADDQVSIERVEDSLVASPPPAIAGKLEMRGMGIVDMPFEPHANLVCAVRLRPVDEIDRLPDPPPTHHVLGLDLPTVEIDGRQAGATARLGLAFLHFGKYRP